MSQAAARRYNVVDSSGWLEYFGGTPNAQHYASAIEDEAALIVPVITIYEVFKRVRQLRASISDADLAATFMQRGLVVDVDLSITLSAACNSLPFADSLIYATAQQYGATLWTQDAHFASLPGVKYFPKT